RRRPGRRPGLQRPAGLLRRRDVPRPGAPAGRALPRRAAARAARPPRPAPGEPGRERAHPRRGRPGRPGRAQPRIAGGRGGGRRTPQPGRRPDRLRRPSGGKEFLPQRGGRLVMRALIWKEWRENLKWAALPTLVILIPVVLFGGLGEPPAGLGVFPLHLLAAVFGAALGFL